MTKQIVLKLLREHTEEFLSGEAISRQAGVSRAAVWKAVEQLRQEGYGIESVPNRGYRLTRVTARLRPEELAEQFRDCRIGRELLCFDTIDSTNNELKRRAVSGTVDGTVILADQQTGGRGRRGRSFVSPAGKGLYLSAALRPRCPLSEISTLTAWTAVALCDAVEAACGVRPGIKWPNDLVLNRKKLCGILTELEWEAESGEFSCVIIGAGINVSQDEADFGPEVAPIAISLAVGLTALTVALGLVVLCAAVGAGAAGVGCIAMGAVAVWAGFAALLGHGIATTMYFVGGGMLTAGIGLLLLGGVVFLVGAALRGAAWLLERVLRRGEARA